MTAARSFNVLTDPWIPLDGGAGQFATYVELMTGARDAADVVHPRDDVRFFTRMLLSALTQALFGDVVPNAAALRMQLAGPLPADVVRERVAEVSDDFELVGPIAFLQGPARKEKKGPARKERKEREDEAPDSLLVDAAKHRLYRTTAGIEVVGVESAVPLLYAAQAFCRKGGTGYFPGVRGAPPVTTLIKLEKVRASVWANVLHGQWRQEYPEDRDRAWRQEKTDAAQAIGLVEGLFWQPLAARLSWARGEAICAATGSRVENRGIAIERLGGRMRAGATQFAHPYSPIVEDGKKFLHLKSERPAWTGLGNMLPGLGEDGKRRATRPAPVVEQWAELDAKSDASLVMLDYATKDASVVGRFVELFPLSAALRVNGLADFSAKRVEEADGALKALRERLFPLDEKKKLGEAFPGRTKGRKNASDATAAFWQRTEAFFWTAFDSKVRGGDGRDAFREAVKKIALAIFDETTSILNGESAGLTRVVVQRRELLSKLRKALNMPRFEERST